MSLHNYMPLNPIQIHFLNKLPYKYFFLSFPSHSLAENEEVNIPGGTVITINYYYQCCWQFLASPPKTLYLTHV